MKKLNYLSKKKKVIKVNIKHKLNKFRLIFKINNNIIIIDFKMTYINIPSINNTDLEINIINDKKNLNYRSEIIICESMFEYINLMKKI